MSNTWVICLGVGDNPLKGGLIPHEPLGSSPGGKLQE